MEKSVAPCHCQVLQEALPHHQLSAAAAQADGDPFLVSLISKLHQPINHHNLQSIRVVAYHLFHAATSRALHFFARIADS